jgi:hypothetical protein
MGGRKPASIRRVLGNLLPPKRTQEQFENALLKKEPGSIAKATVRLFLNSRGGISNLGHGLQMLSFFNKLPPGKIKPSDIKLKASQYLDDKKNKQQIEMSSDVSRLIIDSATRALIKRGVQ